ncbi:MAG: hypothetical protein U9Q81_19990 [Pseudomonadota bacterium]|nr:hypothetical protein [Pseudomonadota bacterium]
MITAYLRDMFLQFSDRSGASSEEANTGARCVGVLSQAVEHVVDETYSRLRTVPGYARRLKGPVASAMHHIDEMVETFPDAVLCCRSAFGEDPRINAFFVNPLHLQEVFSQSEEVRELFNANPAAKECWALLCMHKEERRQLGMALNGDAVQKDVIQTAVSFADHQVVSPGVTAEEARCALKCCVFNGLLTYIRRRASSAKTTVTELETRLKVLRGRLKEAHRRRLDAEEQRTKLQTRIEQVEQDLKAVDLRLVTLEDHLNFVAETLAAPDQYLSGSLKPIRLSRMGIKMEDASTDSGYELTLSEIRIATHEPRVGSLVRFPREELLPQQDFAKKADLFLAL